MNYTTDNHGPGGSERYIGGVESRVLAERGAKTKPITTCDMCGKDCQTMARLVMHVAKYHPTKG